MHAAPVVTKEGLRHESGHHPMFPGNVFDNIFVHQTSIRHDHEGIELHIDLCLSSRSDFMMMNFDADASFDHCQDDFAPEILLGICGRNGEVSLFIPRFVSQVRFLFPS
jgi:hypothetical protein